MGADSGKVILRPHQSQSVFAVHQEWLCEGPDCQSWGILEERQATAWESSGEVKTLLSIRAGSGAFPGGPRTGKVSEGCQVKNQNIGPEDCISEHCNPSVLT